MKELSIKEKAKRYNDAIEKAEALYKAAEPMSGCNVIIETIFPELKESEEEKVRKAIIKIISNYVDNSNTFKPKMLDWLEKQGEPIDKIVKRATNEKQRVLLTETNGDANIDWDTRSLQDVKLLLEYGLDYIKKLEKQGEQKKSYDACDSSMMDNKKSPYGEKRDFGYFEENPTDKVEPKFRLGDWIISKYMHLIMQILNNDNGSYETVEIDGTERNDSYDFIERNFKLWTIADAKDGDVLAVEPIEGYSSSFVAIYKKQNGEDFDSFCFVGFDGNFYKGENGHSTEEIHPATKEQRDLLFQKMKESGYEWSEETHQLKRIEQKPAEWNEEVSPYYDDICEILINLLHSETANINKDAVQKDLDWLKSLKYRYTWKPSDEQIMALRWVLNHIPYDSHKEEISGLLEQIKKLRKE